MSISFMVNYAKPKRLNNNYSNNSRLSPRITLRSPTTYEYMYIGVSQQRLCSMTNNSYCYT